MENTLIKICRSETGFAKKSSLLAEVLAALGRA
jgi:hypothetical protein